MHLIACDSIQWSPGRGGKCFSCVDSPGYSSGSSSVITPVKHVHPTEIHDDSVTLLPLMPDSRDTYAATITEQSYLDIIVQKEERREFEDDLPDSKENGTRRRVRGKRPPSAIYMVPVPGDAKSTPEAEGPGIPRWKLRKKARVLYGVESAKKRPIGMTYNQAFLKACSEFSELSECQVVSWVQRVISKAPPGSDIALATDCTTETRPDGEDDFSVCYSPGMLFTWNTHWLQTDAEYQSIVKKWIHVPDVLVKLVSKLPQMQTLFERIKQTVEGVVSKYKCRHYSVCLEVSTHSLEVGKIHCHCFIERDCKADKAWAKWVNITEWLVLEGVRVSHSTAASVKNRGRGRIRALTEGHYYCQAKKVGHIMHHTTCPIWGDIFPDSRMVMTLWRTRKMSTEAAKAEVLCSRDKVPNLIQLLDTTMSLEYAAAMECDAAEADLSWKKNPFKPPSAAEVAWVKQFAVVAMKSSMSMSRASEFVSGEDLETSLGHRRFKFLIYDGPSRLGKTELACAWFGSRSTLVVNAQGVISPNLRPMQTGRYTAILFDEGTWRLPAANKALFQASSRPVELSQSQCNDRCYQVLMFRVPMIICTNNFWEGCDDPELREWIELNSYYVKVEERVFKEVGDEM